MLGERYFETPCPPQPFVCCCRTSSSRGPSRLGRCRVSHAGGLWQCSTSQPAGPRATTTDSSFFCAWPSFLGRFPPVPSPLPRLQPYRDARCRRLGACCIHHAAAGAWCMRRRGERVGFLVYTASMAFIGGMSGKSNRKRPAPLGNTWQMTAWEGRDKLVGRICSAAAGSHHLAPVWRRVR